MPAREPVEASGVGAEPVISVAMVSPCCDDDADARESRSHL